MIGLGQEGSANVSVKSQAVNILGPRTLQCLSPTPPLYCDGAKAAPTMHKPTGAGCAAELYLQKLVGDGAWPMSHGLPALFCTIVTKRTGCRIRQIQALALPLISCGTVDR